MKNLFVSFTKIDKLGINPTSSYNTPLAICSYPAEYVVDVVGMNSHMGKLPFAGNEPYANLFTVRGNIIHLQSLSDKRLETYYNRMRGYWATLDPTNDRIADKMEQLIEDSADLASQYSLPGGRLWYVAREVAHAIAPLLGTRPHIAWSKLFREIGIDGVVDTGSGIIHHNEPTQAMFFSIKPIEDVQRYNNKWTEVPGEPERLATAGKTLQSQRLFAAEIINRLTTADAIIAQLNDTDNSYVTLIKDTKLRLEVLKRNPYFLAYFRKPTPDELYVALANDFSVVKWAVKAPSEEIIAKVINDVPIDLATIDLALNIPLIKSQSLQFALVNRSVNFLRQFKIIRRRVVEFAIAKTLKTQSSLPRWLFNLATRLRLPTENFKPAISNTELALRREFKTLSAAMQKLDSDIALIAANIQDIPDKEVAKKLTKDFNQKKVALNQQIARIKTELEKEINQ